MTPLQTLTLVGSTIFGGVVSYCGYWIVFAYIFIWWIVVAMILIRAVRYIGRK